jgi:Na+/H+ antiporter NhaC
MEAFGGVAGFVSWLEQRRLVASARGARLLAWGIGLGLFIETNITLLVTGAVCRRLFDRHGESRARLAYLADSTSAPICILIPFNAWGALVLGLLAAQGLEQPLPVFAAAVPLNFYALAAVALAGWSAWSGWAPGAMSRAAVAAGPVEPGGGDGGGRARLLVMPLAVLVAAMPVALWVSGGGSLVRGSGSAAALAAVMAGNGAALALLAAERRARPRQVAAAALRGARDLLPLVAVLDLAMALGGLCDTLGTGRVVAGALAGLAAPAALLPMTFLVSALVAFATGTSWGTFAIMVPIAVPAAQALGLPPAPFVAAALSGGVFGDHASPISDTTVVAALAAGTDVVEHVRTQLPYALSAAAAALAAFALTGLLL